MINWKECAENAIYKADDQLTLDHTDISHPGNLILFLFFTEAHAALHNIAATSQGGASSSSQAGAGGSTAYNFAMTVKKASTSLRTHSTRIYDAVTLSKVPFIGPALVRIVTQNLWTVRSPPPPDEDDLEIAAAIADREKKERTAERKKAKEKKEAKTNAGAGSGGGASQSAAASVAEGRGVGGGTKRKVSGALNTKPSSQSSQEGVDLCEGGDEGLAPSKRPRQAKEYKPQVGTANYAFLITLYISTKSGVDYETKETLMKKAETSGLSNKSLFGTGQAGGGNGMHYDGWSSFNKSLVNRTPPLVQAWSNPKKVRLTAEGLCVAAELYKDAVERCKVTAVPNLDPNLDIVPKPPSQAARVGAGSGDKASVENEAGKKAGAGSGDKASVAKEDGKTTGPRKRRATKESEAILPNPSSPPTVPSLDHLSDLASRSMYAAIARCKDSSALLANLAGSGGMGERSRGSTKDREGVRSSVIVIDDSDEDDNDENKDPRPSPSPTQPNLNANQKDAVGVLMAASRDAQRRERERERERERGSVDSTLTFGDGVASHSGRSTQKAGHVWKIARLGDPRPTLPRLLPPIPPGKTFDQQYEVVLVIDHREQIRREQGKGRVETLEALVQRIRDKGIPVISDLSLPIGDVVWVARSRTDARQMFVLDFIMERKGVSDLASSIKDHRYIQQKYWLKLCGLSRTFYLVEGDPDVDLSLNDVERKAVKTAILQTHLNGFHLLRSSGPHPTLLLLSNLTRAVERVHKGMTHASTNQSGVSTCLSLDGWMSRVKKLQASITVRDMFGLILCAVPGAGEVTVEAILDRFSTWHELWAAYKRAGEKGGVRAQEMMLAGIQIENSTRTVGPELSRKIFVTLFKSKP